MVVAIAPMSVAVATPVRLKPASTLRIAIRPWLPSHHTIRGSSSRSPPNVSAGVKSTAPPIKANSAS